MCSLSDSYADVEQFRAHCDAVGYDVAGYDDSDIEQALRRATAYLDSVYGRKFIGEASTFEQSLEWPRKRAKFRGRFFPDNEIPASVIAATCEAAFISASNPSAFPLDGALPKYPKVENLLLGLIQPDQSGYAIFGSIARV